MADLPPPILVIGAGGAGLIAAWKAASMGARVLVLERNKKPGIKLLISGGGQCNVTHDGTMEEMRTAFVPREARFLKHAFHAFTNDDVRRLLAEHGVHTAARPNGRIFPASGRAADVVNVLVDRARMAGATIRLNTRVSSILAAHGSVSGVIAEGKSITSHQIILATGGASYKKTGTTGDGFLWASAVGHTIVPIGPALAPMRVVPRLPTDWRGVAVRGGSLAVYDGATRLTHWRDDILFTHEGISGPAALEVSRTAASGAATGEVTLLFDFFPDVDFPALDATLNRAISAQRGKHIATILEAWLPNRIVPYILGAANVPADKRGYVLTRDERRSLVHQLKSWNLGTVDRVDIDRGEVTAGGISLDEVDPRTMLSRKVKGFYVAGEVLDIAGPVGGYNLQAALSTGFVAGAAAAKIWLALHR